MSPPTAHPGSDSPRLTPSQNGKAVASGVVVPATQQPSAETQKDAADAGPTATLDPDAKKTL